MNIAKYVNDACHAAVNCCPQFVPFDDDQTERVGDKYFNVATLDEEGLAIVAMYWNNPNTIGGDILWDLGYSAELPEDVLRILKAFPSNLVKRHE